MVLIDNSIQSLPSTALLEIVADKEELEHQHTFMPVAILFKSAFDGISDTIATPRTLNLGGFSGGISVVTYKNTVTSFSFIGPGLYFLKEESNIGAVALFTVAFAANQVRVLADEWEYFTHYFTLSKPSTGYSMTLNNPYEHEFTLLKLNF